MKLEKADPLLEKSRVASAVRQRLEALAGLAVCVCTTALAACGCPDTVVGTSSSPDHSREVIIAMKDCGGAVGDTNLHVQVGKRGGGYAEILSLYETPFVVRAEWRGNRDLAVTVDCPTDSAVLCAVPGSRAWSISKRERAQDVRISFGIGERLAKSPDAQRVQRELR